MSTALSSHRCVHIVPHTHWDREWYLTYQQFRIHLVRLIDSLLAMMEDDSFTHYLLDGQTIVLEDYLEIRPEKGPELCRLVSSGRLAVGPWYVLPDLFLVSGESLIRNLQVGRRVASRFGEAMDVGYMPDQFGFITQMPQILRGFGIETAVVWRGFAASLPQEIWWQSPDGSQVLTHKLDPVGGYLNAADLSMESPEKACDHIRTAIEALSTGVQCGQFLLMNGVDHRFPDPRLPEVIRSVGGMLNSVSVRLSSLADYFDLVARSRPDLPVVVGEQRRGEKMEMLQGTLSARMYLKQANERAETLLALQVEPLCAFAWLLGADYPSELLLHAWTKLLENHAHDSICGCSLDEVHSEMMTRFASVQQIGEMLGEHATKRVADALSDSSEASERSPALLVFNTLPWARTEMVEAEVRIPSPYTGQPFSLWDGDTEVPYTVLSEEDGWVAYDAAASLDSFPSFEVAQRYIVRIAARDVPGWGYKAFEIRPAAPADRKGPHIVQDLDTEAGRLGAETDCLRISFNRDGTFDLLDRRTGNEYLGLHWFEDSGDCGDEYCYCPPQSDSTVATVGATAVISEASRGPDYRTFRVECELRLPQRVIRTIPSHRSDETRRLPVVSYVTVVAGVPRVDIVTQVHNEARDHRLRVLFPTDTNADTSFSETAFDVVSRDVSLPEHAGWKEAPQPTHPQLSFCGATGSGRALVIGNRGLREYELCADARRTLAVTLLRCVEWGSRGDLTNTTRAHREDGSPGTNYMYTPGAQCQGQHVFHYSVIPTDPETGQTAGLRQAYNHKVPMVAHQRLLSGRVPTTDRLADAHLPDGIAPSALTVAGTGDQLIVRLSNLSDRSAVVRIGVKGGIGAAALHNLAGRSTHGLPLDGNEVAVEMPPRSVVSLAMLPCLRRL